MSEKTIQFEGRLSRIFFQSRDRDNPCTIGILDAKNHTQVKFKVQGILESNHDYRLTGKMENSKYGPQLGVTMFEDIIPDTIPGLARFLEKNPAFEGIGPVRAGKIAAHYKNVKDLEDAMDNDLDALVEIAGLPKENALTLRAKWNENKKVNEISVRLSSFGLTHFQIRKLIMNLGENCEDILRSNPYRLIDFIDGYGFRKVDDIAMSMGVSVDDPNRVRAGLEYILREYQAEGHCYIKRKKLMESALEILDDDFGNSLDPRIIKKNLDILLNDGRLVEVRDPNNIAFPYTLGMAEEVYEFFSNSRETNRLAGNEDALKVAIEKYASTLNEDQMEAVTNAFSNRISVISGKAGSGKSYTIAAIYNICRELNKTVSMAAPTGKAAKRMEELSGHTGLTIHRLLGYDGNRWNHNREFPLPVDVVIVDEVSMLDLTLAWRLFSAISKNTMVVLVGDHHQLPPIQFGNILRDVIDNDLAPTTVLNNVVRQASTLKHNCVSILEHSVPRTEDIVDGFSPWLVFDDQDDPDDVRRKILELVSEVLPEMGFDAFYDVQVLTPQKTSAIGVHELNFVLQQFFQAKLWNNHIQRPDPITRPKFYINDKVIQTKNDYNLNVMNGTIGYIKNIFEKSPTERILVIQFVDRNDPIEIPYRAEFTNNIKLAYALTIHKVQGSEFPCSILVMHKKHSFMHKTAGMNMLYTGVTRGKKTVCIVGDDSVYSCAKIDSVNRRKTILPILHGCGGEVKRSVVQFEEPSLDMFDTF